jgi:hypothetical protein
MAENLNKEYNEIQPEPERSADNKTSSQASVFAASVESFRASDVKSAAESRKVRFALSSAIRLVVMLLSFIVFCYSVFSIAYRISDDNEQEDLYALVRPRNNPVGGRKTLS